ALCRVVPGIDLVAFVACGWTRVPLARFALASLLISALYLPLMLYLVVVFGDAMDDHVGLWAWPFLLAVVAVIGFVRNRIFNLRITPPRGGPAEPTGARLAGGGSRRPAPAPGRRPGLRPGPRRSRPAATQWFKMR